MMHAIYHGQVYLVGDDRPDGTCQLLDPTTGIEAVEADYGDPELLVDPTDDQIQAAENRLPLPPETCATCHQNPRHEHAWQYRNRDGYGVCNDCGRKAVREARRG